MQLNSAARSFFTLYVMIAAFSTYFCMYAFRKPFASAEYRVSDVGGLDIKTLFIVSQIVGYALSKFIGIRTCSEIKDGSRFFALIFFIVWAEIALILFGILPIQLKPIAMFLNGLPLGMVWGVVVRYLEGRCTSEILLAGLTSSFIVASGAVKDIGRFFMDKYYINEWWMPAFTGMFFLPPFLVSVWFLNQVPAPNAADVAARSERKLMDAKLRAKLMLHFAPGFVMLFIVYFFLTAYRDYRDNFGVEIFKSLECYNDPTIFTQTETIIAFLVVIVLMSLNLIKENRFGLIGTFAVMVLGVVLMGTSTLFLDYGRISGFWWMTCVGLGSYLAYVPFGSVLFDRLIAYTRVTGNAVFAIYVADAIGYVGVVGVLLYQQLGHRDMAILDFFKSFTYFLSSLGFICIVTSCIYFLAKGETVDKRAALQK